MRVLITGVTGFVGSHLLDYVVEHAPDTQIFGVKRWRSPREYIARHLDRVVLWDCDLRDMGGLLALMREVSPEVIFHLAAQSYVPASYQSPNDTLSSNVLGTANLLEAVRLSGIDPLIHVCSSSEVYGQVGPEDVPITEECSFRPASPYAVSKVAEDMLGFQYFTAYGLKTVRTRMFTHTGPRQDEVFVTSAFAKQVVMIGLGLQEPVVRVGNLDSVRTFADVRDTVRAYWLMVQKYYEGKVPPGAVYNIGGATSMTVGEMLEALIDLEGLQQRVEIQVDPALLRPADVTLQVPSTEKFYVATGWEPRIPFETTLKDLLGFWRSKLTGHSGVGL